MTLDSFINVPLLVAAGVSLLLLIFLIIIKIKNSVRSSFVFFAASIIVIIGAISSCISDYYFYFVISVIMAEVFSLPYAIFLAFDNPEKRAQRKAEKKNAESNKDSELVSKEVVAEIEAKHQRLLDVNKTLVSKLSSFFNSENSMENFLEYCNDLITQKVSADGCVILIADDYDNTLAVKSFKGSFPPPYKLPDDLPHKPIRVETNLRFAQFSFKDNIFGDVFTSGEPAYIPDSIKDPRIFINGPEDFLRCGSYIFVPIKQQEETLGLIALSRGPDKTPFTKDDFNTAVILSDAVSTTMKPLYSFLAYAEHTELNKGGSIASKYQKDLIPQKLPVISGLQIGCFLNPAENVCGDFYDIIVSRKDKVSFIMTDVAGKGMNSLIVMIMIRAMLRLTVNTPQTAATILSWANRGLCSDSSKIDHFASVALINYNSTTKEAEIATCGNNPVFYYSAAENTIKQISTPGEPMGVTKETEYKDINLKLNSGDIIATCTDGLLESLNENGVQYSIENFTKAILKNSKVNAKDISNRVKDDLRKYIGTAQQYDDQSLLVIKIQ